MDQERVAGRGHPGPGLGPGPPCAAPDFLRPAGLGDRAQGILVPDAVFGDLEAADLQPVGVDPDVPAVVHEPMDGFAGRHIALDPALGASGAQRRATLRLR